MKVKEKAVNFYLWEHVNATASLKASPSFQSEMTKKWRIQKD